ncbi:hypothetical protein ABZ746_38120 [Streptomyces sp. NPDC020096]
MRTVLGCEDRVERVGVLAVAIAQEIAEARDAIAEIGREVPGGLRGPGRGRTGGDAQDVHAPGADLITKNTYSRFNVTVSTWRKSAAGRPEAWAQRN